MTTITSRSSSVQIKGVKIVASPVFEIFDPSKTRVFALLDDGTAEWKGKELESDDELRQAVITLASWVSNGCMTPCLTQATRLSHA